MNRGQYALARDLVVHVEDKLRIARGFAVSAFFALHEVLHDGDHVARVHLARVIRHAGREVRWTDDRDSGVPHDLIRLREFTIAASLGGQVYDH